MALFYSSELLTNMLTITLERCKSPDYVWGDPLELQTLKDGGTIQYLRWQPTGTPNPSSVPLADPLDRQTLVVYPRVTHWIAKPYDEGAECQV
jgi:hypothetical protein